MPHQLCDALLFVGTLFTKSFPYGKYREILVSGKCVYPAILSDFMH